MRAIKGKGKARLRHRGPRVLSPAGQARLDLSSRGQRGLGVERPVKASSETRGMNYGGSRGSVRPRR